MPFKSEKQRRYMHANLPKIAQQWEKKYKKGGRVKVNEGGYIGKAIKVNMVELNYQIHPMRNIIKA